MREITKREAIKKAIENFKVWNEKYQCYCNPYFEAIHDVWDYDRENFFAIYNVPKMVND